MSKAAAEEPTKRLGYLLKHAQFEHGARTDAALAPADLDGRRWAVLLTIAALAPISQHAVADHLAVDRTTMVALTDALEEQGLIVRRRDPDDRRRNLLELTPAGRSTFARAKGAVEAAEREYLAPLSARDASQLRALLSQLVQAHRQR